MSEKILLIDLGRSESESIPYSSFLDDRRYGRGLVLSLFEKYLPDETGRYDEDNLLVIAPGLFAGTQAPSACRMFVASVESRDSGIQMCNTAGNMPQKLGSLGIAAVVIKGKAAEKNTVVCISKNGVDITCDSGLQDRTAGEIIHSLKGRYGRQSAIIGSGIAGDMLLSLSSFFCTYPDGVPEYYIPRDGFGDVWGAKNLRAVVVDNDEYFARECSDPEHFRKLSRQLARSIIDDEICGSALPSFGSMTIMKILESGDPVTELHRMESRDEDAAAGTEPCGEDQTGIRHNKTCAPLCVIGCLNRHSTNDGKQYSTPAQVETQAAIRKCFGTDDYELAAAVQNKATDIGIVPTEFVTACKTYAVSTGTEHGEEKLLDWLDEVRSGSLVGRSIASRTQGVSGLFSDIDLSSWIDRKAVQDEKLFNVRMNTKYPGLSELSELELLYSQVFTLENLGFCIFASFALLDRTETFELMAEMFEAMTGREMSGEQLITEANSCLKREREYLEHRWMAAQRSSIPPFTKVLYRFFDRRHRSGGADEK